jgi:multiple sugar transport system permease protein
MMLPSQVTLIPLYVLWSRLQLVNTLFPLMIPSFFGSAFNIFLLRQFMLTIPVQMDDAARIDGANWWQIYTRIILPLASPALGVVAIYEFTFRWNDFLGPLIYLNDPKNFTVSLGLQLLNSQYVIDTQRIMAQTTLSIIPVLVVFFVAQRYYLQGLVITGIKG